MNRIILVSLLLFAAACHSVDSDYVETDKIQLLYRGDGEGNIDDKEKIILNPSTVPLSIQMDIEQVTQVELSDVSSAMVCKTEGVLPSPSTLAVFTFDPKANIKKIDFRIRLPCAAYHRKFDVMIKVKSLVGNYVMRKKLPVIIRFPGEF